MSTVEQEIGQPSHPLVNANTTARSIMSEQSDRRLIPPDLRTRRFGYNPGLRISMDPVHSGLQISRIEPGVALLFETGPIKRQRHSVDPNDRSPLDIDSELLAGEGLESVLYQHAHMGFCELLPVRGKSDAQAGGLMAIVHPALKELAQRGLIKPCLYDLDVCITCRGAALDAIKDSVPDVARPLWDVLKKSIKTSETHLRGEWNKWVSEVASTKAGVVTGRQLGALNDNHLWVMEQLHERTPTEQELARIAMQTEGNAAALRESMSIFAEQIAATMKDRDPNAAAEIVQLRAQQAQLQEQLNELLARARNQDTAKEEPAEGSK